MNNVIRVMTLLAGVTALSSIASAQIINLEPPKTMGLGNVYSQDGVTFTNSFDSSESYINWYAYGEAANYDADFPGSTLVQDYYDTLNTLTRTAGGSFFFGGISLADAYNSSNGGSVDFTFNYANGTSSTSVVTLAKRSGLQAFAFNQANVTSVSFKQDSANPTAYLQFDYAVVDGVSAVPLPASAPMFGAALLGLAGVGYAAKRKKVAA